MLYILTFYHLLWEWIETNMVTTSTIKQMHVIASTVHVGFQTVL